jgi:hypothetical protein
MSFKELEQRDLVNSFKELRDNKQKWIYQGKK